MVTTYDELQIMLKWRFFLFLLFCVGIGELTEEETIMTCSKVLFQHLHRTTEETHKNFSRKSSTPIGIEQYTPGKPVSRVTVSASLVSVR